MLKNIINKIISNIKKSDKNALISFLVAAAGFAAAWLCKSTLKKRLKSLFKKVFMGDESFRDFMEGAY